MKQLSSAQRKKVEARAAELIAEEMTLRELRHARKLTQVKVAKTLGVTQDSVSRLEKRSDLFLSALRKNGRGHGRESFAGCRVSRPCASGSVRHCGRWSEAEADKPETCRLNLGSVGLSRQR
jgi:DNA-binding XRE family transcriptional regulator